MEPLSLRSVTEDVAGAVARALGERPASIEHVPTGEYNTVYRCELASGTVYFKAFGEEQILLDSTLYRLTAEAGVPGPELLAVEFDRTTFPEPFEIVRAAEGAMLDALRDPFVSRDCVPDLARVLHLLHGIPVTGFGWLEADGLRSGELRARYGSESELIVKDFGALAYLTERGLIDDATTDRVRARQAEGAAMFAGGRSVLLHNDLGTDHIFVDPNTARVTALIDWGDTRLGDPVWEFASLAIHCPELMRPLADAYASEDPLFEDKLELCVLMRLVGEARWVHERWPEKVDNWRHGRIRALALDQR